MAEMQEKPQDARAVANYILDEAPKYNIDDLSLMKLQKLIFMAHGWSFYFCREPLIATQPQAWQYGPIYPDVYWNYSGRGSLPIESSEKIENKDLLAPYQAELSPAQKDTIAAVLQLYGPMTAFKLSEITHFDGSPWDKTVKRDKGFFGTIPLEAMRDYYIASARERGMPEKPA